MTDEDGRYYKIPTTPRTPLRVRKGFQYQMSTGYGKRTFNPEPNHAQIQNTDYQSPDWFKGSWSYPDYGYQSSYPGVSLSDAMAEARDIQRRKQVQDKMYGDELLRNWIGHRIDQQMISNPSIDSPERLPGSEDLFLRNYNDDNAPSNPMETEEEVQLRQLVKQLLSEEKSPMYAE